MNSVQNERKSVAHLIRGRNGDSSAEWALVGHSLITTLPLYYCCRANYVFEEKGALRTV